MIPSGNGKALAGSLREGFAIFFDTTIIAHPNVHFCLNAEKSRYFFPAGASGAGRRRRPLRCPPEEARAYRAGALRRDSCSFVSLTVGVLISKATKRITLSHLRTYDDARKEAVAAEKAEKRAAADATKSTVKKINASVEKTTLGDIAGLAALKSAMEAAEKKAAAAPKKAEKAEKTEE